MSRPHARTPALIAATFAVAVALAASGASAPGAAGPPDVDVFPTAGTTTAGRSTQISFRRVKPGQLKGLTVKGSITGKHTGRLVAHSDGHGVSFLPDKPFHQKEVVTVHADNRLVGASAANDLRFQILTRPSPRELARFERKFHKDPEGEPPESQYFKTRPELQPPDLEISSTEPGASRAPIFYAVKGGPGQDGPEIRDASGRLLWYRRVKPPLSPYDFRAQRYLGKPVLTWWQGKVLGGKGRGYGVMLDNTYTLVKHVRAGNGFDMDQHEFELTDRGTAFINCYEPVRWDLSKIGGDKHGIAWDSIVQEIDVKTGLVEYEWHSLARASVTAGTFPYRKGLAYDPFHVNSVSVERDGNLLLSARNTNALWEISRHSGNVLWRIGGKRSDFQMGPGTEMIGQHQAVRQRDGTITVFDNGGSTQYPTMPDKPARGIRLKVDMAAKKVSLVREYHHPGQELFTRSQGSMQALPNGDVFIGWGGGNPFMTEFGEGGQTLVEASILPAQDDTYRAYRMPWRHARPADDPAVFAKSDGTDTTVYVSWNGATDVARWDVLAGDDPGSLTSVGTSPRQDFETEITLTGQTPKYVAVRALDAASNELGRSAPVQPKQG